MPSNLSRKLRLIREAETTGRGEFSQLIGIPKKTLEGIEQTGRVPRGDLLEAVCRQWPRYTLWLMTDLTDDDNGQVRPEIKNPQQSAN